MAVVLQGSFATYTGLSSDDKPAAAPAGSQFTETDTGRLFTFDGARWQTLSPAAMNAPGAVAEKTLQVLEELMLEMRAVRLGEEMLNGLEAGSLIGLSLDQTRTGDTYNA